MASEDRLHTVCTSNNNDSNNVYGMFQIDFKIQFYKHDDHQFEAISGRMHLVSDVQNVIAWAQRVKASPMSFIDS